MQTIHARISGRVQGVGYRAWTVEVAHDLNLKGWVRNRSDGTVEAVFQGEPRKVREILEKCEDGPLVARVTNVQSRPMETDETFSSFTAKPTL